MAINDFLQHFMVSNVFELSILPLKSSRPTMIVKLGYRFMVFGVITSRSKVDQIMISTP